MGLAGKSTMKEFKECPQVNLSVDSDMIRIGKNIKKIRLRSGDSMEIFAEWLGVKSESTVASIENGTTPVKAAYLFFLAKELDIPLRELLLFDINLDFTKDYTIFNCFKTPEVVNDRIAKNIKYARINKVLTEKELARQIGCCEKTVERLEKPMSKKDNKSYISIKYLFLIAKVLNIDVEDLFIGCE